MRILRVLAIVLIAALTYYLASPRFLGNDALVQAAGDLTIDWGEGISSGEPIFVVDNMQPGDMEDRNVEITNDSFSVRPVGVRVVRTGGAGDIETVIDFVISEQGTDIYGGSSSTGSKTLWEFFTESGGLGGIFLFNLSPTDTKTINFKATFKEEAGSEFQSTRVVFDLIIGIFIDLPFECEQIELLATPIVGTYRAETLTGTPGNDLIMGLEGADKIYGNGGDDCILGGSGADKINGNDGNDVIFGGNGADSINGNNGDDLIVGGHGADNLKGENGQDHLIGNEDTDSLSGGNQNDILEGNEGPDSLEGGNGDDSLVGGPGVDSASGDANIDICDAEIEISCEA